MEKSKTIKKTVTKKVVVKTADKAVSKPKNMEKKETVSNGKMKKVLSGTVVSVKMTNTVVVAIERKVAHKLYRKLIKVTKRLKADTNGMDLKLGDVVKIEQTRPMSKDKNFKVIATPSAKAVGVKKEETK